MGTMPQVITNRPVIFFRIFENCMNPFATLLAVVFTALVVPVRSQCINGFVKSFPEPTADYSLGFGKSVSMHGNYLAVGVPDSDTLGRESGIVYIFEKTSAGWTKIASMVASNPVPDLRLGTQVKLTENYLLTGATAEGGKVYIYKKPVGGWASATELTILTAPNTEAFGTAYAHPIDLAEDENTIVIADAMKRHNLNPTTIAGSLYVFHKNTGEEWSNSITPVEIKATTNTIDLGRSGSYIQGTRVYTGTPFTESGHGHILIYNDPTGTFSNPVLEAKLSPPQSGNIYMDNMVLIEDGIMASGSINGQLRVFYYQKPVDGQWYNAEPTSIIDPDNDTFYSNGYFIRLATNGPDVFALSQSYSGIIYLTQLKKGADNWSDPTRTTIDGKYSSAFGKVIAVNAQSDITTGFVSHPWNSASQSALSVYSQNADDQWITQTLYSTSMSTRNHSYGQAMVVYDETMFVSAIKDNTLKANGGKVYVYEKTGITWEKVSEINTPTLSSYDPNFGSALATNGNFLAVGAKNFSPSGAFFIYKKGSDGWNTPEAFQEIRIPDDNNTIQAYGDNVAMNERWLIIPYVDYEGSLDVRVAIYEFTGDQWTYRQSVTSGYFNFFSKFTTVGVAIYGNTLVASNRVYKLNQDNVWEPLCVLSPTDPETLRFTFPSFEIVANGSYFGQAVTMDENTIVIGAPRRDSEEGWDAGAVYVFKKQPDQQWTSRTETLKIVPDQRIRAGLFGASLSLHGRRLVVGAPADERFAKPDLNENPVNDAPGNTYVFNSSDDNWTSAQQVKSYTGETDFRDSFGFQVYVDAGYIYIAAKDEDIITGRTSGSIYITDTPPTVEGFPPVCLDNGLVTLNGLPAGGTWSGPGIENPGAGLFNPVLAGTGAHTITYTSLTCPQTATLKARVHARPIAALDVASEYVVCAESNVEIPLAVKEVADAQYQWFFRGKGDTEFSLLNGSDASTVVGARGDYRARVFNDGCEAFSEIASVTNESIDLTLNSPGEVCGTPNGGIALTATPTGGTWSDQE
jgi:hypothetical protein